MTHDLLTAISDLKDQLTRTTPPRWMEMDEAATYMSLSKSYLYKELKDRIGYVKEGKRILFDRHDIDRYLEENKIKRISGLRHRPARKIS